MANSDLVREFHRAFDVPIGEKPRELFGTQIQLRVALIEEEFSEYRGAIASNDIVEIADALGDLLYVVYGAAIEHGIPIDAVFAEIHRSNMTKCDADGKPYRRDDGKIIKGPRFEPPNIAEVLAQAADTGE